MAPPGLRDNCRALPTDDSQRTDTADGALHGWAGIEDHVLTHDVGRFGGYADDIDTLLVFAGLFSAILTAFVVQTYPMLQADGTDTTNQLIALGVSAQLRLIPPEAANTTLMSLTSSPQFSPSPAIRWINCLFFLSLVLSLAAAFFGIRAKQWIREYLKWNASLSTPRENVLVRQVRMEAWDDWNVDATISSVPALLELAMILFLAGATILVWTLDNIVAIVVTVFVAAFLVAVTMFTVLPVVFVQCPYRSPTAWICVRAVDFIRCTVPMHTLLAAEYLAKRLHLDVIYYAIIVRKDEFLPEKSWRERDLGLRFLFPPWWTGAHVHDAAFRAIREEVTIVHGEIPEYVNKTEALRQVVDTATLARALSWVDRASQDIRITRYITEAIATIHQSPDTYESDIATRQEPTIQLSASSWLLLGLRLYGHFDRTLEVPQAETTINRIRAPVSRLRLQPSISESPGNRSSDLAVTSLPHLSKDLSTGNVWKLAVVHILASDLRLSVQIMHKELTSPIDSENHRPNCIYQTYELVNTLCQLAGLWTAQDVYWRLKLGIPILKWPTNLDLEVLRLLLCDHTIKGHLISSAPGLRTQAFKLALCSAKISLHSDRAQLALEEGTTDQDDLEDLLLHYPHADTFDKCSEDDLNIFLIAASRWLLIRAQSAASSESAVQIIDLLHHVMKEILARRGRAYAAESYSTDQLWLRAILDVAGLAPFRISNHSHLRALFHTLAACYRHGYLTGDQTSVKKYLHDCLQHTHEDPDTAGCTEAECAWRGHHCADEWSMTKDFDCPLLRPLHVIPQSSSLLLANARVQDAARLTLPYCSLHDRRVEGRSNRLMAWVARAASSCVDMGRETWVDEETGESVSGCGGESKKNEGLGARQDRRHRESSGLVVAENNQDHGGVHVGNLADGLADGSVREPSLTDGISSSSQPHAGIVGQSPLGKGASNQEVGPSFTSFEKSLDTGRKTLEDGKAVRKTEDTELTGESTDGQRSKQDGLTGIASISDRDGDDHDDWEGRAHTS